MDLIIDLGNTNKKLALFSGDELVELHQFPLYSLKKIRDFFLKYPGIENCILSSVISHSSALSRFLSSACNFIELDEHTPLPIVNRYRTPKTLGKDRLAAAVAGSALFPGNHVLVINAGTCITYDFINNDNEYLGVPLKDFSAYRSIQTPKAKHFRMTSYAV